MIFFYTAMLETDEQKNKFELLYERYYGLMYHAALSVTHNPHHAEDCVHETCLALIGRIDTLRMDADKELISYLYTLTRNHSIDYLRKLQRARPAGPDDAEVCAADLASAEEVFLSSLHLERAIERLSEMPEKYRDPLLMRVKGYSIQEIAQTLCLAEGTVRTHIFRARKILTRAFEEE